MEAERRGEPSAGRLFTFFRREIAQFAGNQTAVTRVSASHPLAHHAVLIMETKFSHVHEWRHRCRAGPSVLSATVNMCEIKTRNEP